jgi:hypothetical protein
LGKFRKEKEMSKGFDVNFEGIDMDPDMVQSILKKYKKIKKYQRSNIFEVKTMDGTEDIVSEMIKEGEEYGPLD